MQLILRKNTLEFDKTTRQITTILNQHNTVAKLNAVVIALSINTLLNVNVLITLLVSHRDVDEERLIWIGIWRNSIVVKMTLVSNNE